MAFRADADLDLHYHLLRLNVLVLAAMSRNLVACAVNVERCVSGAKTMARAFISHPGTSQKSSMQNVERGHKECTQVWVALHVASIKNRLVKSNVMLKKISTID